MLQNIREKLTGWVAVAILGVIALSLVVTFGNIDTGFTGSGTAATVNGEDVPVREFRSLYQQRRQQWETNFRSQMPEDIAENMAESVLQNIVRSRVVAQHVSDQGYRVNDSDLIESIESLQAFQVGGEFSQPSYESMLRAQGLTPQRFEYDQRQNLQIQQFLEGVTETAFYTPSEFRRYIALDGEERDVEYILLSPQNRVEEVEVSDAAIEARYEENPDRYQTQESVTLQYIELDYEDILAETSVSEEDARQYFEANPQEFGGPEERLASHILIATGEDEAAAAQLAAELRARIDGGESFTDLAAQYSDDTGTAGNGGVLGWLGSGDAPAPEFEEALFALETGEVSEPVRTEFGYHLIRLDDLRQGANLDFEDVRIGLIQNIREEQAADRYAELIDELDEQALESLQGLTPIAESMGLELQTVDEFTRNGGEPFGFVPELVETVFSFELIEDGDVSPVIEIEDGRAVIVHVTEHRPASVRPLEDVREEIRAELRQEEAIGLTASAGARLLDRLNDAPDSVAEEARSLPVGEKLEQKTVSRGDRSLPPDLAAAIFRTPKPASAPTEFRSLILGSGEYAVYRVLAVDPGAPEDFSQEERDIRKQQLSQQLGASQAAAVVETLVNGATVNVAPNLIESELGF